MTNYKFGLRYIGGKFSPFLVLILGGWVLPNLVRWFKGIVRHGGQKYQKVAGK